MATYGPKFKPNGIIAHNGLIFIKLTQGKWSIIIATDYALVAGYRWCALRNNRTWYAVSNSQGRYRRLSMHHCLLPVIKYTVVDHKNGCGLDNRRSNLRYASLNDNQHNSRIPINNTSGFKGVHWSAAARKWYSGIMVNSRKIHIGVFDTNIEAAEAYSAAAIHYRGKFASINASGGVR